MAKESDLAQYELTTLDWQAVEIVARWLHLFREATTQMSATHSPTLSVCHSILRSLQDNVKDQLKRLPDTAPTELRTGLLEAHQKLSEYHLKIVEESPFYLWACSEFCH